MTSKTSLLSTCRIHFFSNNLFESSNCNRILLKLFTLGSLPEVLVQLKPLNFSVMQVQLLPLRVLLSPVLILASSRLFPNVVLPIREGTISTILIGIIGLVLGLGGGVGGGRQV